MWGHEGQQGGGWGELVFPCVVKSDMEEEEAATNQNGLEVFTADPRTGLACAPDLNIPLKPAVFEP